MLKFQIPLENSQNLSFVSTKLFYKHLIFPSNFIPADH